MIYMIEKEIQEYLQDHEVELHPSHVICIANRVLKMLEKEFVIRRRPTQIELARQIDELAKEFLQEHPSASIRFARIVHAVKLLRLTIAEGQQFVREHFEQDGCGDIKEEVYDR